VSARLLCESAWLKPVPLTGPGLIVGDPDTHDLDVAYLPLARLEAAAIRDAFYADATYVGRRPDGSTAPDGVGDPAEVLTWLADPAGGSMMHLACHAGVLAGASDDSSYLLLADGRRLSAEEMVRALSARKGRDLALALLAACSSGESRAGMTKPSASRPRSSPAASAR
jgi:CHAT domain